MSIKMQQYGNKSISVGRTLSVSSTPKQYLPVSWEISSKYLEKLAFVKFRQIMKPNLPISFFSWMNLTLANDSAASSIACNGENSVKKRYLAGMPTWQMCDDIQNLIEAILATIGDIHKFDNLSLEIAS